MAPPLRRYKSIAAVFRQQSGLDRDRDGQAVTLNHQLDADHSLQDSLLFYAAERDPQKFVDSFDQLVAFVDASLDLYRVRLRQRSDSSSSSSSRQRLHLRPEAGCVSCEQGSLCDGQAHTPLTRCMQQGVCLHADA